MFENSLPINTSQLSEHIKVDDIITVHCAFRMVYYTVAFKHKNPDHFLEVDGIVQRKKALIILTYTIN